MSCLTFHLVRRFWCFWRIGSSLVERPCPQLPKGGLGLSWRKVKGQRVNESRRGHHKVRCPCDPCDPCESLWLLRGKQRSYLSYLEHLGTSWNILEHLGTSWNILEHLGTSWNILEPLQDWQSLCRARAKLKTFMAHSGTQVSWETPSKHLAHAWHCQQFLASPQHCSVGKKQMDSHLCHFNIVLQRQCFKLKAQSVVETDI